MTGGNGKCIIPGTGVFVIFAVRLLPTRGFYPFPVHQNLVILSGMLIPELSESLLPKHKLLYPTKE